MVKSMTGFGKGEAALRNKKITVEIRSLNSKQLDLSLRLPAVYRQSEYEIRNLIARTIQRGKVDVFRGAACPSRGLFPVKLTKTIRKEGRSSCGVKFIWLSLYF